MKIQEFIQQNPSLYKNEDSCWSFWAKKFSEIHLPNKDGFSGITPCGVPMLGNNYSMQAIAENRIVCEKCLEIFLKAKEDDELSRNEECDSMGIH